MTSTVSAIEAIEKAMEGVTPGTWSVEGYDEDTGQVNIVGDGFFIAGVIANQPDQEATASHIAACNPVAMREVLALARQAEALQRENAEKDERIALLRESLLGFEHACEQLAATRTHEIYTAMIDGGQAQELLELDNARRRARSLLGGSENAE